LNVGAETGLQFGISITDCQTIYILALREFAHKKAAAGMPRRLFIILIVKRNPSLADLAATYSSKP
jgi:hypothetical protein